jgi:hypothetical protein
MKNINRFEKLAMWARHEVPPNVDVSHAVISKLQMGSGAVGIDRASEKPLMWLAGFSSIVASVAAVLAIISYDAWIFELTHAIVWVMQ